MSSVLAVRVQYAGGFELDVEITWTTPVLNLFGGSGCGKSTLLEAIAGLRPEVEGRIVIYNAVLQDADVRLSARERRVGWVPQDGSLFPHLSVQRNIDFGAGRAQDRGQRDRAIEVLEVGHLMERRIVSLSGGERQRVAVARALASGARLLLLDEPLAALDTPLRARILGYLVRLRDELGVPIIYVSHDPREVQAMGGHLAVLDGGRLIAQGPPDEVLGTAPVLSILESLGAENHFRVRSGAKVEGLTRVLTPAGTPLLMALPAGSPALEQLPIAVRAEDILLATARLSGMSARNQLEGRIASIEADAHRVFVRVDIAGEIWVARVTASAVAELGLLRDGPVWLVIKTASIHPIA